MPAVSEHQVSQEQQESNAAGGWLLFIIVLVALIAYAKPPVKKTIEASRGDRVETYSPPTYSSPTYSSPTYTTPSTSTPGWTPLPPYDPSVGGYGGGYGGGSGYAGGGGSGTLPYGTGGVAAPRYAPEFPPDWGTKPWARQPNVVETPKGVYVGSEPTAADLPWRGTFRQQFGIGSAPEARRPPAVPIVCEPGTFNPRRCEELTGKRTGEVILQKF